MYMFLFYLILIYFGCCGRSIIILVDALVVCDGDVGVNDVCVESFATKFSEVKEGGGIVRSYLLGKNGGTPKWMVYDNGKP